MSRCKFDILANLCIAEGTESEEGDVWEEDGEEYGEP